MTLASFAAFVAATALLALPAGVAHAQSARSSAAYGPRSEQLPPADQFAILDIIARMNQAIDANDYTAYAEFYSEDGIIDSGFGEATTGRAAITASLEQSAPFITNKRHVASNVVINGSGEAATAVYYLTVLERATGLTVAGTAVITDAFQRGPAGWQVVRHTTRMDPATLQAMSAAMSAGSEP